MATVGTGSGVGATLGDGTTTYENIISVALSGITCGVTDISSSGSDDQYSEFLPDLIDAGFLTCVLRYQLLGSAAEVETATLNATFIDREIDTWTLTLPGGSTWACSGYIVKVGQAVQYKGGVQQQVVIKLTGIPSWSAAS